MDALFPPQAYFKRENNINQIRSNQIIQPKTSTAQLN